MDVQIWDVPINATWSKSNILVDFAYNEDGVEIVLLEEESKQRWVMHFEEVMAFKIISNEWAKWSTAQIPPDGGFFEIMDSPWLQALGTTENPLAKEPHHFIICCEQELIEVAAWECHFTAK
ncbi:MAG: hypothetical protein QGD90_09700 [Candidatus Hydrogenedentes bacterium]|nr:hypothetical protein [Candidatus Hydrogenedentota bacterium]